MKLTIDDYNFIKKLIDIPRNKFSESDFPDMKITQFKYKINKINYLLKITQKKFLYKRNCYYYIKNKEILVFLIKNLEFSHYDKALRKNIILSKVLKDGKINISKLMEEFSQSRTSIKKDLKELNTELAKFSISLVHKYNFGISIQGKEEHIRLFFLNYIFKNFNEFNIFEFKDKITPIVFEFLKGKNSPFETSKILFIILYIQFFRTKNNFFIRKNFFSNNLTQLSKAELEALKNFLGEKLEDEYLYFSNFAYNICYNEDLDYFNIFYSNFNIIYNSFIEALEKNLYINLKNDPILINSLRQHLKTSIYKLANKIPIYNPAVNENLDELDELILLVKNNLFAFEKYFKITFPLDEIIFIVFHIKAALTRNERQKEKKNVLLVCNLGTAITEALFNELNKYFRLNIIDSISYFQFKIYDLKNIDFIIHTIPNLVTEIPNYLVSPILTEKNIKDLKKLGFPKK